MGRVISDAFVQNAWALGDRWREQRKEGKIRNAMAGWDQDPETVIQEVFQIDRNEGMKLAQMHEVKEASKAAAQMARQKTKMDTLGKIAVFLDAANDDPDTDLGAAYDKLRPIFKGTMEMPDEEIEHYRGAILQNPSIIKALVPKGKDDKPIILGPGSQMRDEQGNLIAEAPFAPKGASTIKVKNAKGGEDVYVMDPTTGSFIPYTGGAAGKAPEGFDNFYERFLKGAEGGYTADDGNGAPANYGINQKYHPDVDVKNLTPEKAKEIYRQKYWEPYVQEGMSPALAAVHADTVINMGPDDAEALMAQSGGDPNRYLEMRRERYKTKPGYRRFGNTWNKRLDTLSSYIGGDSGPTPAISSEGPTKGAGGRWRQLSRQEVVERGLDKTLNWQESPTGETRIIGPAPKAGAKGALSPEAAEQRRRTITESLDSLINTAQGLKRHKGLPRITGIMGPIPDFPGGNAADARAKLDTLKSQISLNVLQAMRDMSKTGGALGNVSNYEIKVLENNLGALNTSQSMPEFQKQLDEITRRMQAMKKNLYAGTEPAKGGGGRQGGGGPPPAAVAKLKSNPSGQMRKFFDMKYGPGAAKRALGN
jgi:hypothetical protein